MTDKAYFQGAISADTSERANDFSIGTTACRDWVESFQHGFTLKLNIENAISGCNITQLREVQ